MNPKHFIRKTVPRRSAMAALAESFENLVESQRKKLGKEEFKKADENFERIVNKARSKFPKKRCCI